MVDRRLYIHVYKTSMCYVVLISLSSYPRRDTDNDRTTVIIHSAGTFAALRSASLAHYCLHPRSHSARGSYMIDTSRHRQNPQRIEVMEVGS